MNGLSKFLVEGILNEVTEKVVALFGGGFKPPTKGHLEVVNQGLQQSPEVTEVKILVGGGERDGFTQRQAVKIWNLYNDIGFISKPATVIPVSSPFKYYKEYLQDNPEDKVYVFIGSRPGDDKDQFDVKQRSEYVKKYSDNVIPTEVATTGGVSGTEARKLFKTDIDSFRNMFPENLTKEDFKKILNILGKKSVEEGRKKKKDPKKGTGKKPKGSGRRLYTDEDPKDTVGVKFSTRQDIIDTLSKKSFKAKSHARQSQIINLIHQRVRAALSRTKDPAKKKKLKSGFEYIKGKKEASKKKTERLKKQKSKNENIDPKSQKKHKGKSAPFGSAYEPVDEGDTYEKMAAKGKKAGSLKQGTVRKRLKIPKDKKIPLSKINKEISRLKKMDKDKDKKGVQLGDKNQKYYKALQLSKTLKTTTNVNESEDKKYYDFQIRIKNDSYDGLGTTFSNLNGRIQKSSTSVDGNPLIFNYRNVPSLVKAAFKAKNDNSEILIYNDEGKGKVYPLTTQNVKLIKRTIPLNENATYTNYIDYKQQIKDLTKHMIKKGMNILPLPRVIFKHSDTENASQFLGKTAYYSPSDTTVVLYTEGRHPKDIARSFAHEMIHHIQNLEGRLHDINTTNTNDDDHLNDIEREAYTKGNMVFRNWTDNMDGEEVSSLSEKKKPYKHKSGFNDKLGKDPFGLNQYARELVSEVFKKSVTIDMDPIIKALEFEMPTGQETDENIISIIDAAPQGKVPHPVFLDFYAKFDRYFGEENDNRMLDNFGLEYLLSNVLNLPSEDIQIVMNHYNTTDQDSVEWFEQHDNELERDEEYNIPGFDDANDDHESVVNYRRKQLAKSLEEQEKVRIFNKDCGCDKA
jgi:hypothetical protein